MTKIINILKDNGIILYPTDTIWGIGCDATNPIAIKKMATYITISSPKLI